MPSYAAPLVSVIIFSSNGAAIIEQTVTSVAEQTYPFIECIVIDDGSADGSRKIIGDLCQRHRIVSLIVNERRIGQGGSLQKALKAASGSHVIFLEAGDALLPGCIETHVATHIALRKPVGFTSVDVTRAETEGNAAASPIQKFANAKGQADHKLIRDVTLYTNISTQALTAAQLQDAAYYVHPLEGAQRPWSTISGACFRREALDLIMGNSAVEQLHAGIGDYLLRGVGALTGSAVIAVPFVQRREHKTESKSASDGAAQPVKLLIDYFVDNASETTERLEAPSFYRDALDSLATTNKATGRHHLDRKLLAERDSLRAALGAKEYDHWIAYRIVPKWLLLIPGIGILLKTALAHLVAPMAARRAKRT